MSEKEQPIISVGVIVWGLYLPFIASNLSLVRYGHKGAEYLEFIQRQYAVQLGEGLNIFERIWSFRDHLSLLDGEYPPLLHLLSVFDPFSSNGDIIDILHQQLLYLLILCTALDAICRTLTGTKHYAWLAWLSLVCPAIIGSAGRYYYDLPLATWCTTTFAFLLASQGRSAYLLLAALFTGIAALTKWQAGLYLAPFWIWALYKLGKKHGVAHLAAYTMAATLIQMTILWPLLRRSRYFPGNDINQNLGQSSLDIALGQGQRGSVDFLYFLESLLFYLKGLVLSSWGPLLSLALLIPAFVLLLRKPESHKSLGWLALMVLPPIIILCAVVTVRDERFLLPLLPLLTCALLALYFKYLEAQHQRILRLLFLSAAVVQWVDLEFMDLGLLRSPTALRGWNQVGETQKSPYQTLDFIAQARCLEEAETHHFILTEQAEQELLHGWRWALERHCRPYEIHADNEENRQKGWFVFPTMWPTSLSQPAQATSIKQSAQ